MAVTDIMAGTMEEVTTEEDSKTKHDLNWLFYVFMISNILEFLFLILIFSHFFVILSLGII